jgi:hypothetical protein
VTVQNTDLSKVIAGSAPMHCEGEPSDSPARAYESHQVVERPFGLTVPARNACVDPTPGSSVTTVGGLVAPAPSRVVKVS